MNICKILTLLSLLNIIYINFVTCQNVPEYGVYFFQLNPTTSNSFKTLCPNDINLLRNIIYPPYLVELVEYTSYTSQSVVSQFGAQLNLNFTAYYNSEKNNVQVVSQASATGTGTLTTTNNNTITIGPNGVTINSAQSGSVSGTGSSSSGGTISSSSSSGPRDRELSHVCSCNCACAKEKSIASMIFSTCGLKGCARRLNLIDDIDNSNNPTTYQNDEDCNNNNIRGTATRRTQAHNKVTGDKNNIVPGPGAFTAQKFYAAVTALQAPTTPACRNLLSSLKYEVLRLN